MQFLSTRNQSLPMGFSDAVLCGLAPDGGLFVPENLPHFDPQYFLDKKQIHSVGLAIAICKPFFEGDALEGHLDDICGEAFSFPTPLIPLPEHTAVLDLTQGPTAAFKDVGAQFLAACVSRLMQPDPTRPAIVLTATSGDTGAAVAAAFHHKPNLHVFVLYPRGRISEKQERQITTWGANVLAFAVNGTFDDCQAMVKAAFQDPWWKAHTRLLSANSINIGRLLPQTVYYAQSALSYFRVHHEKPGFIVPTGNLGNAVAALWAKRMGFPIREVVLATNSNQTLVDFFDTHTYTPRASVATLASAMDVGNPSNVERLLALFPGREELFREVRAFSVDDDHIRTAIADGVRKWKQIWCPHTATAASVRERLATPHWILVSTAHPAKFESIVAPLVVPLGAALEMPRVLADSLQRPTKTEVIDVNLDQLKSFIPITAS